MNIVKLNSRWRWLARRRLRKHIRQALKAGDGVVHAGFEVPGPHGKAMFIACTCSGAILYWPKNDPKSDDVIRNHYVGDWAKPFRNKMGVKARGS